MSTPHFFDVHTHAHFAAFRDDSDAVIRRALEAGVWMVNVGTQRDTSRGAVETAERYASPAVAGGEGWAEGVYAAVGLHPIHTERSYHDEKEFGVVGVGSVEKGAGFTSRGEDFDYEYYKTLAQHPKVVAIGECGLDYYRLTEDTKEKQKKVFEEHIALAHELGKPLMIHCRNAFPDLIQILKSKIINLKSRTPGVVHFFTGSLDDARALLDLGFSFSFGGVTTFTSDYDEAVRFIPLDRILSETDAPYVAPVPYRGERNEPLHVREVVRRIADIRGEDFERVREALVENALRVFGIGG
jgi:TatD DNase family protein